MSVPSSKITVTCDSPERDSERVCSSPGRPAIAVSMAKVMRCSVSSGEKPAAWVLICTWTLVMSGTASIGSF
ncbi:hypothetical protein D3C71_2197270 [compost metagenome]